ncbi:MAG TPA: ubiquinone/menaquinone biosynthesis methyltransferase [Vicinamibacteria bacterium]|nr:ubiquinone/menaquinone biosynthesis methyltransferase [Vicinamibacteria bacterium]
MIASVPAPRLAPGGAAPREGPPTPGAPERAAVRSMFDRIAPRYDLLNRLLSAGIDVRWRRACVDLLPLPPAARVLDLCTGTADLLLEALGRDSRRQGVGVDLSPAMLVRGAAKLAGRAPGQPAALLAGDVSALPLADASVDGALVAFGIRNVSEPARAFAETLRVLRPGGALVVLEFALPKGLLGSVYRFYFRSVLPRLGGLISGDREAYAYLPASVERFATPRELAGLLEQAGYADVQSRPLTGGIAWLHRGTRPGARA